MLEVVALVLGAFGLTPVIADCGKYMRMLKIKFSRTDLVVSDAVVTFRIDSPTKIYVFGTAKYLVLRNKPTLAFPITNNFGPVDAPEFSIDNVKIENSVVIQGKDTLFSHQITDKAPGETAVFEFSSVLTADENLINLDDDGLSYSVDIFPCRHLRIQVVFPKKFVPRAITFSERSPEVVKAKVIKEQFGASRMPFRVDGNRKAVEWLIEYPKFNRAYRIGWSWR